MVTGIVYVVLEILQKNAMWVLGIFTGIACAVSFGVQHVWASMGLNLYYVGMSVVGLIQWKKAGGQVGEGELHLRKLPKAVAFWSAALLVIGSVALIQLLRFTRDAAPELDGTVAVLSVIATWWLAQSYLQQWLLWIVAIGWLSCMPCIPHRPFTVIFTGSGTVNSCRHENAYHRLRSHQGRLAMQ